MLEWWRGFSFPYKHDRKGLLFPTHAVVQLTSNRSRHNEGGAFILATTYSDFLVIWAGYRQPDGEDLLRTRLSRVECNRLEVVTICQSAPSCECITPQTPSILSPGTRGGLWHPRKSTVKAICESCPTCPSF